jgi:hypothetical protein
MNATTRCPTQRVPRQWKPHIPERFRRAVTLHVVRTLAEGTGPLLLGISGPPGIGKSFGVKTILHDLGVKPILVSSGRLEDAEAGAPARLIRQSYLFASRLVAGTTGTRPAAGMGVGAPPQPAVVLFEDVDTGLGDWGETSYTVNRQTAIAELMALADRPGLFGTRQVRPVPVLLTGNAFSKLYGPLIRPGRMELLEWILDEEERFEVLLGLFPELELDEVAELSATFPQASIAFFGDLRRRCCDAAWLGKIDRLTGREAVRLAAAGMWSHDSSTSVTFAQLLKAGQDMRRTMNPTDHLSEDRR